MKRDLRSSLRGFTIVELLIVIVVIGILAAITIVAYNGIQSRAQRASAASTVRSIETKLKGDFVVNEAYPGSITDCPTPAAGNLCIPLPDKAQSYYRQYPATTGVVSRVYKEPSYDLGIMYDSGFLYSGIGERSGGNEFMQYADLAPYIDKYGANRKYELSFDVKSSTSATGEVMAYLQNGNGSRYVTTGVWVPATTDFTRHTVIFTPTRSANSETQSLLAFYGTYSTNVMPVVKNVQFTLAP